MFTLWADEEIAFQLGAVELGATSLAFLPDALGNRTRAPLGLDPRGHQFFEPAHADRMINESRAGITPSPRRQIEFCGIFDPDQVQTAGRRSHAAFAPIATRQDLTDPVKLLIPLTDSYE